MRRAHWVWIMTGLVLWAVLVLAWTTGPYDCTAPDSHHHITCR